MSTAVVTGAGRGIGRATAVALASRGFDVALLARTVLELEETAGLIRKNRGRALVVPCDVSRASEVERASKQIERDLSSPAVVVNNAGVVLRSPVQTTREEDWDAVIDVNLKGTFLVTRALLPTMLARGSGRVLAVGSISSTLGTARQSAYAAAKWGVVGFIKSLAEELRGTGLQAMAVLPGAVGTIMLEGSGYAPEMTAEDVARLVVYAALDAPAAMNGSAVEMFGP